MENYEPTRNKYQACTPLRLGIQAQPSVFNPNPHKHNKLHSMRMACHSNGLDGGGGIFTSQGPCLRSHSHGIRSDGALVGEDWGGGGGGGSKSCF